MFVFHNLYNKNTVKLLIECNFYQELKSFAFILQNLKPQPYTSSMCIISYRFFFKFMLLRSANLYSNTCNRTGVHVFK